ncbi:MAG: cohesin domain-containing protein [Candidatus Latescibacterota bacterium]
MKTTIYRVWRVCLPAALLVSTAAALGALHLAGVDSMTRVNLPARQQFALATSDDQQFQTAKIMVSAPEEVQPGDTFPVLVEVENVTDLFGAGLVLNYPEGVRVEPNSAAADSFLGNDVVFFSNTDANARQIQAGISQKSGQPGASGGGIVISIRFTADSTLPDGTMLPFTLADITAITRNDMPIPLEAVADTTVVAVTRLGVWPGDTNNDGTVSQSDVLPLGLYWGKTGPARENPSSSWKNQICPPWTSEKATYADSNGDGIINQYDVLTIGINWGKTASAAKRTLTVSAAGNGSGGIVLPKTDAVWPLRTGNEFWVNIEARDLPLVRGLSLKVRSDRPDLVQAVAVENGTFLGNDTIFVHKIDAGSGEVAAGMACKAGQTGAEGSGTVVRIQFRALSDIPAGTSITFSIRESEIADMSGAVFPIGAQEMIIGSGPLGIESMPFRFDLKQNYPNPFNPTTSIEYEIPEKGNVRLEVLNIAGQLVRVLVDAHESSGRHTAVWNALDDNGNKVSAGVYIFNLITESRTAQKKMLLLP